MQIDDFPGACLLMQPIHILGDQVVNPAPLLQKSQSLVPHPWLR
jgi:hypothetical protein